MTEPEIATGQGRNDFWLDRSRVCSLLLAIITALILYASYQVVRPFMNALIWSLALSITVYPIHRRLQARFEKPNLAAGITVFLVGLVILIPIVFVTVEIGSQGKNAIETMQSPEFRKSLDEFVQKQPILSTLKGKFNPQGDIKSLIPDFAGRLPNLATGTLWKLTEAAIVLLILFFLFRDKGRFLAKTRQLLPLSNKECDLIFERVDDTVRATVYGHLVMALIQGTLGGLVFWALGLPAPLLWGTVMTILAVLPILGAAIVWIPAAGFLIFQGAWGKAAILILFGSVVIGLIDNLLYPVLVGRRIREHTLLVFLSLVGGIIFLGAAGIIAGPLLLALADTLIRIWRDRTAP
jgi:predicted PurR-regulated permease PerM